VTPADAGSPVPPGQRPCPICGQHTQVESYHGLSIDTCPAHGLWLDRGELPTIIARVHSGRRLSRGAAIRQAKRDGKMSGALFGWLSLLWD
jgi:Zn-finger nucleic acid-binding protein